MKSNNKIIIIIFGFFLLIILDAVLSANVFSLVFFNKTKDTKAIITYEDLAIIQKALNSIDLLEKTKVETFVEVNKKEYKIKITNASGNSGAAKKIKDLLEKQSGQFKVSSLDNSKENLASVVKIKKNISLEIEELILKTVKVDYPEIEKEILAESFSEDIIIILGD